MSIRFNQFHSFHSLPVLVVPDTDGSVVRACGYEWFPDAHVQSCDLTAMEGLGQHLKVSLVTLALENKHAYLMSKLIRKARVMAPVTLKMRTFPQQQRSRVNIVS